MSTTSMQIVFNIPTAPLTIQLSSSLTTSLIDWGDGSPTDATLEHTYKQAGEYTCICYDVSKIGNRIFDKCKTNVTSLVVPAIEFFGAGACQGCSALESVTFIGEDTQIGERAFQNCSALKAVRLPNNLTELSPYIFYGCSALQHIDIPTTVTTIDKGAFSGAGLIDLAIPDGVVTLGVQSGDYPPFGHCRQLQTITFGSNFQLLANNTFQYCIGLETIIFKASKPVLMADSAFYQAINLKTVYFGGTPEVLRQSFIATTEGETTFVPKKEEWKLLYLPDMLVYEQIDNTASIIASFNSNITELNIPTMIHGFPVTAIKDNAFFNCDVLQQIVCDHIYPPSFGINVFSTSATTPINVYVPQESITLYEQAWQSTIPIKIIGIPAKYLTLNSLKLYHELFTKQQFVQADWSQTSETARDYIKNKPNVIVSPNDLYNDTILSYQDNQWALTRLQAPNWDVEDITQPNFIWNKPFGHLPNLLDNVEIPMTQTTNGNAEIFYYGTLNIKTPLHCKENIDYTISINNIVQEKLGKVQRNKIWEEEKLNVYYWGTGYPIDGAPIDHNSFSLCCVSTEVPQNDIYTVFYYAVGIDIMKEWFGDSIPETLTITLGPTESIQKIDKQYLPDECFAQLQFDKKYAGQLLYIDNQGYPQPLQLGRGLQIENGVLNVTISGNNDSSTAELDVGTLDNIILQ